MATDELEILGEDKALASEHCVKLEKRPSFMVLFI
jgi:hypothetical protein